MKSAYATQALKSLGVMATPQVPLTVSPENLGNLESRAHNNANHSLANWGLGAAAVGGGLAGLAAIVRKMSQPEFETDPAKAVEKTSPVITVTPKKKEEEKVANTNPEAAVGSPVSPSAPAMPKVRETTDIPWLGPATAVTAGAGLLGGYMLSRHMLDKSKANDLKKKREQAEAEFQQAINQALAPRGLQVSTPKTAGAVDQDVEACMNILDFVAHQPAHVKKAFLDKAMWWAALAGAVPLTAGAVAGWRYSANNNPARKELKDIQHRMTLQALNSPTPPLLMAQSPQEEKQEDDNNTPEDQKALHSANTGLIREVG
jgi:hypothetical protein